MPRRAVRAALGVADELAALALADADAVADGRLAVAVARAAAVARPAAPVFEKGRRLLRRPLRRLFGAGAVWRELGV